MLPNHTGYYTPSQDNDEGLALFMRPHITITETGDVFVHRHHNALSNNDRTTIGRNVQYVQFTQNDQDYTIMNFHGLWTGAGKTDTPDRLGQSEKIRRFIDNKAKGKIVLVGDFNLNPDTQSMAILKKGMRDLITENGVTSTRSHYHTWPNKFADYIIVSNDVNVIRFEVLQAAVSDHLPMLLEFS